MSLLVFTSMASGGCHLGFVVVLDVDSLSLSVLIVNDV